MKHYEAASFIILVSAALLAITAALNDYMNGSTTSTEDIVVEAVIEAVTGM